MIRLLKYLKTKEWILLVAALAFVALQVWCNITIPEYTIKISQYLSMPEISPYWQDIVWTCMQMLLLAVGVVGSAIIAQYLASVIVSSLIARIRSKVFGKVNDFSETEINKFSIPSLITRSTNDLTQLQQVYTMIITMGFTAPLTAVFAIIKIVSLSRDYGAGTLSWVNVISVLAIILVVFTITILVLPKFKKIQTGTDKLNMVTRENLTGLKVIRAVGAEAEQEEKFEQVNKRFTKLEFFVDKVLMLIEPSLTFIMQGTTLAIVWIIGLLAEQNPQLLLVISAFTQYSIFIIMSFTSLSFLFMLVPRGIVCAKRINEILQTETSLKDGEIEKSNDNKGTIEFKNVSFRYPDADADVLENISFTVKQGQTVAFIGSTGSGKSTLINLIPRFYDCSDGEILVNGQNVKNYKMHELHKIIGYVPQKGILFSGTVKSNIKYGKENATDEEVKKAIEISQSDFVYDLPNGLDYHISQGGKNVSGGQKQRLSIARAIITNPDILIFDDSFSALDYKTDKIVRENLNREFKNTTKVIVAQRIGTIMHADQIIVLDKGKMVGKGKHKELLKKCKVYREIALSQLSEEELQK